MDQYPLSKRHGIFKRELSPVERFERTLKDRQAARQKLAHRLSIAETLLAEKRGARLAVAGAADAKLDRAETQMRAVEERAKTLRLRAFARCRPRPFADRFCHQGPPTRCARCS
jgi:hypothetical protein